MVLISSPPDDNPPLLGLACLMRMAHNGIDLSPYVRRAASSPDDATMLMSLAVFFQLSGNTPLALELQAKALGLSQHYRMAAPSGHVALRMLVLLRAGEMMDNTPVDFLLEGSDIAVDLIYLGDNLAFPESVPEHDILFVAVSQSDQNNPLLHQISAKLKNWPRPVLNHPVRIAVLSRNGVSDLLGATLSAASLRIPVSLRLSRQELQQFALDYADTNSALTIKLKFPLIIRPLDSHGGKGLAKLDNVSAMSAYLQAHTSESFDELFYLAAYVDYRSQDGLFRKYRVALIDGHPYICHMALSDNWVIHYMNAGMEESAAKRAEESQFMDGFDESFAQRHRVAFSAINERLQLDYAVIDCAETQDGRLLIFEIDNTGFVHAFDAAGVFSYKLEHMNKLFVAFQTMLLKRSKIDLLHPKATL
ncbi:hypothetical protein AAKU64_004245 [Undibacterium sp. GrIS 1.8]|uniref:ATP-grasp domain-containing protein n=1 Tax=unclassified Undibacterium TaxID=2630295 RepID=UPI003395370F